MLLFNKTAFHPTSKDSFGHHESLILTHAPQPPHYHAPFLSYLFTQRIAILVDVTTTLLDSISNGNRSGTSPSQKRVLLLKPRGFCAGVVRAIDIVKIALETFGAPIYVRREIVHNRYVVNELAEKGAIFVHEIDDVPDGQRVIYSAHGVSPAVREIEQRPQSEGD